ncbi:MAG: D-alanyl-D-alanine carboxypeptidase family protein [Halanaerobiales bacterium]
MFYKKSFTSLLIMTIIIVLLFSTYIKAEKQPDNISATSACLLDKQSGQTLYSLHPHLKRPPASLTKILTAVVALEKGNLSDKVTVSRKAAYQEGSSIYLEEDEVITLEELLYGILLTSGNDAAVATAEHVGGSVENFSELMNKKAKEIGAENSNFVNPSGLPHHAHYSTAYDMALIMKYAMTLDKFAEITSTKYKTISWGNRDWGRGLRNHNKLLWSYENTTGGKTGYTKAAGRCLASSACRNDREVVAVVLDSPDDWLDSTRLLDYGLESFRNIKYIQKGERVHTIKLNDAEKEIQLTAKSPVYITVPRNNKFEIKKKISYNSEIRLPVKKDDRLGRIRIYNDDEMIAETPLLAADDVNYDSIFMRFWDKLTTIIKKNGSQTGI